MLQDNITSYLEWKSSCTNKAAYIYGGHLKEFAKFVKNKPLEDITIEDITNYRERLRRRHRASYANYKMIAVKNFLFYCRERDLKCVSPKLIQYQSTESNPHYAITEEEYKKMLSVLNPKKYPDIMKVLAIRLLWETGIRVSELCDIDISQIDNVGCSAQIISKKTKQKYWIFWREATRDIMCDYLGYRLAQNQRPELFVGINTQKRPTTRTIERWIKDTTVLSGLQNKISPHSFRHGKAHFVIMNGGGVLEVNRLLGHSYKNLNSSLNYTRMNNFEMRKIASRYLTSK